MGDLACRRNPAAFRRQLIAWVATLGALIMVAPSVLAGGSSVGVGPNPADSVNISSRAMPMTSLTSACSGVPEIGVPFLCDTPGVSQIPVPAGATEAEVVVIGGGGGGGSGDGANTGGRGGHGAKVTTALSLVGIESLLITVASGGGGSRDEGSLGFLIEGGSSGGGTVGEFGTYGAAANAVVCCGTGSFGGATGGGMSAIADGTGKEVGATMTMDDLLIIAGGGGGGAHGTTGSGGDGAANNTSAGGDGVDGVPKGGSEGIGGAGGTGDPGERGGDFSAPLWGSGGAGEFTHGSSGGAGYGGGGGAAQAPSASAAAGGSFARSARTIGAVAFMPSNNGGVATTGGVRGGDGGNGSVQITFLGPDTSAPWTLIHQSLPLSESGTCEGLDDEFAAYGTGIRGGWVRSWEPWVNQTLGANGERIGGWACSRVLVNRGGTAWFVMD